MGASVRVMREVSRVDSVDLNDRGEEYDSRPARTTVTYYLTRGVGEKFTFRPEAKRKVPRWVADALWQSYAVTVPSNRIRKETPDAHP